MVSFSGSSNFLFVFFISLICGSCEEKEIWLEPNYTLSQIRRVTVEYASVQKANPLRIWREELGLKQPLFSFSDQAGELLIEVLGKEEKLKVDIYLPPNRGLRPLILFIHGGGFVTGKRDDPAIKLLCREFARRGYVTASIDYRIMCWLTPSFVKAGYCATQDARAAVRYFAENAQEYRIDPTLIYLGGISAGACTAMHAAFLSDNESILGKEAKLDRMYGCLDCVGPLRKMPKIKGVINLAGGLFSMSMLKNDHIKLWSFHGDHDDIIDIQCDVPFERYSRRYNEVLDSADKLLSPFFNTRRLKEAKVFNVCGSEAIHNYLIKHKKPSTFYLQKGQGHTLLLSSNNTLTKNGRAILLTLADELYKDIIGKETLLQKSKRWIVIKSGAFNSWINN